MNGLLLIDKPKDMTSRDVVNIVCKKLGTKKVGHTGTLDPNATGVLVLAIGKALKVVNLITALNKTYEAEIVIGYTTDTLDVTGEVLEIKAVNNITKEEIENILKKFVGKQKQQVPKYSALKVNGKRLYEYARNNEAVELPVREIEVLSIDLISDVKYNNESISFVIKTNVSKGTYIRSLARDIGKELGYPACMGELRRIKQGDYKINDCYTLEDLENDNFEIINLKTTLKDYPQIKVDSILEQKILNGAVLDPFFEEDMAVILNNEEKVIAIYEKYNGKVKPRNVFKEVK